MESLNSWLMTRSFSKTIQSAKMDGKLKAILELLKVTICSHGDIPSYKLHTLSFWRVRLSLLKFVVVIMMCQQLVILAILEELQLDRENVSYAQQMTSSLLMEKAMITSVPNARKEPILQKAQ